LSHENKHIGVIVLWNLDV